MTPAPLQLVDYWATSLHMEACPGYDPQKNTELHLDSISVENEIRLLESAQSGKNGTQWLVGLTIEQGPCADANIPYTFSVALQAIVLALPGGPEGERLERTVKANGPAMLFGAAREMIRALTGRGPHRAIIIPSTNFIPPASPATTITDTPPAKKKSLRKRT